MDRLERLARAMCAADDLDPDAPSETGERLPGGSQADAPATSPQWHRYRAQAKRIVAAFEALEEDGGLTGR